MIGIYFLLKNKKIVYIGQSRNVERRIASHRDKDFDSFRVIACGVDDLLRYEKRLINYFKPELNGHPGGKREGAGRKVGRYPNGKQKEETVPMRIPVSLIPELKELITDYHHSNACP